MEILSNKLLTTAFEASLGKEYPNLFLLDIICHGTPSPKLFEEMEKKYAADIKVSFPRKAVRIIKRTIKKILRGGGTEKCSNANYGILFIFKK